MFENIDPLKSALTSIALAFMPVGFFTIEAINTFFQIAAWIVAILAGIVSIINGVRQWHFKRKCKKQ